MTWPTGYIHVYSAIAALAGGSLIVLLRKGNPLHRLCGIFYTFALLVTCISALMIYDMTGHFGPFHAGALVCLYCTLAGFVMPIFKPKNWLNRHAVWMGRSYVGLLAAALAEALVRVPALHIDSVTRGFEVGIGAMILVGVAGIIFIRAFKRTALRYGNRELEV